MEKIQITNSQLLKLLYQAEMGNSVQIDSDVVRVAEELIAKQDKTLLLSALQIAFMMGRQSVARGMVKVELSAALAIHQEIFEQGEDDGTNVRN